MAPKKSGKARPASRGGRLGRVLKRLVKAAFLAVAAVAASLVGRVHRGEVLQPASGHPIRRRRNGTGRRARIRPGGGLDLPDPPRVVHRLQHRRVRARPGCAAAQRISLRRVGAAVLAVLRRRLRRDQGGYPFSTGNHLMLGIIGSSFSIEYALKGLYENTVGRATEWIAGHDTPEDAFARRTAAEYGTFMHTVPWYEFPFASRSRRALA